MFSNAPKNISNDPKSSYEGPNFYDIWPVVKGDIFSLWLHSVVCLNRLTVFIDITKAQFFSYHPFSQGWHLLFCGQVIGNATALVQSEDWAALLEDAKARRSIVETSTCIAQGLLPDNPSGVQALNPQAGGLGLLRHARAGMLTSGRIESPSAAQFAPQGNFSSSVAFERGRQQEDGPMPGGESDRWPVSGHRGSRLHRDGPRVGFSQRSLPHRAFGGRGSSLSFRRGRG